MTMDRRDFLMLTGAAAGYLLLPRWARAQERFIREAGPWRRFEIVTRIDIAKPEGKMQAWVPVPTVEDPEWAKPLGSDWKTNAKVAKLKRAPNNGAAMVHLQWAENEPAPFAEISCDVTTRDRATDFSRPRKETPPLTDEERKHYTSVLPSDALIEQAAARITENAKTDLGKAKAIYEWIADEAQCSNRGKPDSLRSANPDLNVLYVRLANAAGLPARVIYGLRIAPSQFGYGCLGTTSEVVTKAQHTRAEVWLEDYGWMPVDPADVCKVFKEEPPQTGTPDPDAKIVSARLTLFGAWEGNWIAYNMANDVTLPGYDASAVNGSAHAAQPMPAHSISNLIRPQAETAAGLLDCSDPDNFKYLITVKERPA